jgi:tetratricopeptide (TPR) repeat protein
MVAADLSETAVPENALSPRVERKQIGVSKMTGISRRLKSGNTPRLGALISSAINLRPVIDRRHIKALSLSLVAFNFLTATCVQAADSVPLPIKKISVDAADELVIQFGTHAGSFPSPPHVLDLPGPNHRIVMDFADSCVDKVNMPSVDDLSARLHKLLPAIRSIHYSNLANAGKPTARVVIEVPEQLAVKPRVVKLEEDSVTITLGDHMRDVDIPETGPTEPLGRTSLKEPKKTSNDTPAKSKTEEMASEAAASGLEVADGAAPGTDSAPASTAVVPAVAVTNAGSANTNGTTNANWDWTANQSNVSTGSDTAPTPAADTAPAPTTTQAPAADSAPVPASATSQAPTPDSGSTTPLVAQAPADATTGGENQPRTHGSAPITETFEKFDSPAAVLQPGASTTVTPGAQEVLKRPEVDTPKPATVADTDAKQFQDALKPTTEAVRETADSSADAPLQLKPAMSGGDTSAASESASAASESASASSPSPAAASESPVSAAPAAAAAAPAPTISEPPTPKAETAAASESTPTESTPAAAVKAAPLSSSAQAAVALYNSAYKAQLGGKINEAIADYKGAIAANPNLAEAHSNLGVIYNQQHNFAQALSEFRKALAINPKDAITYNGIGAALRAEKDRAGALKNYQTAVNLDPKLATAHYNLGTIYEEMKDWEKAMDSYKLAVKNDYRLGEAYYQMGNIMYGKKRNDEAIAYFKESLKVGARSDYADEARKKISSLMESEKTKTK